jgi:hypothetical protein
MGFIKETAGNGRFPELVDVGPRNSSLIKSNKGLQKSHYRPFLALLWSLTPHPGRLGHFQGDHDC